MTELKPCPAPWCDGSGTTWSEAGYFTVPQKLSGVRCRKCGCSAPTIEAWNHRPIAERDTVLEEGWQPIETLAGNDWVLLWDREATRIGFKRRLGGWCIEAKGDIDDEACPSHWRKLPEAPALKSNSPSLIEEGEDGRLGCADRAAGLRPQPPAASSLSSIPDAGDA